MPGGRPRKPDSVKAAQGTLQPCRSLEKLAATTTPELAPTPPVGLTKEARAAVEDCGRVRAERPARRYGLHGAGAVGEELCALPEACKSG